MRIVAGKLKGRQITPPANQWKTRPTTDFAKEALFNVLENHIDWPQCHALDLFAGTGNITFELASRGCPHVAAVEQFSPAIRFIRDQARSWDLDDTVQTVRGDVRSFLKRNTRAFDLIFADPPYALNWLDKLPTTILSSPAWHSKTLLVIEHGKDTDFEAHPLFDEIRRYGQSAFSFFREK
jgi:16S rRNA (guanine966-N2)-methyltransferase